MLLLSSMKTITKILSLALGFILVACSGSVKDDTDPDPIGNDKVTILPVIGSTIDRIVFENGDTSLRVNGGSNDSRYFKKFKLDDKNGDITIKFENIELTDIIVAKEVITAQFKQWEIVGMEISNKIGITVESMDSKEKAIKVYNKKAYQTPQFYGFKSAEELHKFWENISNHSWTIVVDNQYNKDFKYQGKSWRYK